MDQSSRDKLPEPGAPAPAAKEKKDDNFFVFLIKLITIVVIFRSFVFAPFTIPSESMLPRLVNGDYLLAAKWPYGFSRYSLPFSAPLIPGRIFASQPERGDIAIFKAPPLNDIDYIKRVIGLPGDTVQVKGGRLYINHKRVKRVFLGEYKALSQPENEVVTYKRYREELPGGKEHEIIERSDSGPLDNTEVYTVPDDHYFMMGDNRDGSQDSRVMDEVGYVPFENFVGRAENVFFSVDEKSKIWEVWNLPHSIRYKRLMQKII